MAERPRRALVLNWRDPADPAAGGSERYAWEAATALRDDGWAVEYLTARLTGSPVHETVDGIAVHRGGGRFGVYPVVAARVWRRRRRTGLVVDLENGVPFFAPFVAGRAPVVLVVHHVHLDQFGVHFPAPVAALGRWLEGRAMPRVYRDRPVVAVSESTRAALRTRLRWAGPVTVVHNGATPPPATPPARRPPGAVAGLVVLGRVVAHKRVERAVRAVAAARRAGRTWQLEVVGTGPGLPALRDLVASEGVGDLVTLHGRLDDAARDAALDRADLHLCLSDGEGWGQVVLDAAARGLPTLATDVPGLRDAVVDDVTGWLLRPDEDVVDGVERAVTALAVPGAVEQVATACRDRAAGYGWPRMRAEFLDVVAGRSDAGAVR